MDIGPDGSLCRFTSSFNYDVCNVKIVPVIKEDCSEIDYKLVLIGDKKTDLESASEKSEEESFSLESLDIELGIEKTEKPEDKTEEVAEEKPQNKNTGNKPFNRRFRPNNKNRHCKNFVSSGQRNFKPYNNGNQSFKRPTVSSDNNNIFPWIEPPPMLNPIDNYQFTNFPHYVPVIIDSGLNTPINSNIDPPKPSSRGLLGNSPYDQCQRNFQNNNVNNFSHNQNYWNGNYSNNYQHSVQNEPMSGKPSYKKHHGGKFWKNKPKFYNRNQDKNQKRRGGGNGHFNY